MSLRSLVKARPWSAGPGQRKLNNVWPGMAIGKAPNRVIPRSIVGQCVRCHVCDGVCRTNSADSVNMMTTQQPDTDTQTYA
jgi:formate hydrogenlyase subunit 6/NADH:ubiquinone oxidoreductase subunit I